MKRLSPKAHSRVFQQPHERLIPRMVARQRRELVQRDHYAPGPRINRGLKGVLIVIALLLLVQSIFQIPLFRITNISIRGLQYVPEADVHAFIESELQRRRLLIFRNDNYFLFAERRFKKRLEDRFYVTVTDVNKQFSRDLSVTLIERISAFVVQTPERYIQLDTSGASIGDVAAPHETQSVIADERSDREQPIGQEYLEQITSIKRSWEDTIPGIRIDTFHLTDDQRIIILSTDKDFRVYFDPEKDIDKQIVRLQLFLADTSQQRPGEYIDLRFDESLFIR